MFIRTKNSLSNIMWNYAINSEFIFQSIFDPDDYVRMDS